MAERIRKKKGQQLGIFLTRFMSLTYLQTITEMEAELLAVRMDEYCRDIVVLKFQREAERFLKVIYRRV
jgi:hypothetical protein